MWWEVKYSHRQVEALERGSVWKAWEAGEILGDERLKTYMMQIMQEEGLEGAWTHLPQWSGALEMQQGLEHLWPTGEYPVIE